jgi:hypothetical protein
MSISIAIPPHRALGLLAPALLLSSLLLACDPAPPPTPPTTGTAVSNSGSGNDTGDVDETPADSEDVSAASSCRKPTQSCSSGHKCCSGSVCLTDDLTPDPLPGQTLTCHACGKTDQVCCGAHRAHSFQGLAKRCTTKNTVCPQSESSDICTPCGLENQPCCIVDGKPHCRDGSKCAHSVAGGPGQEAGSGICIR